MLLVLLSLFFVWLLVRELLQYKKGDTVGQAYMAVCAIVALLCLYPPIKNYQFEKQINQVSHELADLKPTNVQCQSAVASIFDSTSLRAIGYAYPETGEVVIRTYWCKRIKSYLKNPETADRRERYSVMLLAHEAMHIRGEYNEQKTECQAIQRHIRIAKKLGIPHDLAVEHAKTYYHDEYPNHPYYSPNCHPGSEWDERLPDSVWEV